MTHQIGPLEDALSRLQASSQASGTFLRGDAEILLKAFATCDYDVLRVKAVQGLRDMRSQTSLEHLIEALRDDDEDVRVDAAEALGLLAQSPKARDKAIAVLIENLTYDPCADVKLSAIQALKALKADAAKPLLRQLVTGRGDDIEWDADEEFQFEWDGWLDIQIQAIETLGELQDIEAIEPIIIALNDPEGQDLSVQALDALAKIGEPALPTLAICAQSHQRRRRFHAVRTLASMASDKALAPLTKALEDEDHDIRLIAFEALLKRAPSIDLYEKALEDNNEQVRIAAYGKLSLDDTAYLQRALSDPSPKVQLALITRLSTLDISSKDEPVYKALSYLLDHGHAEVSAAALGALAAAAPHFVKTELKDLFEREEGSKDAREQRQWAVIDALGKVKTDAVADALTWLELAVAGPFRSIRLKALTTIGHLASNGSLSSEEQQKCFTLLESYAMGISLQAYEQTDLADHSISRQEPTGETEEEATKPQDAADPDGELDQQTKSDTLPEDDQDQRSSEIAALKAAGLDVGDDKDQSAGPTSSLGAILGHEMIAQELIEQAEEEKDNTELSINEQALLNQARRNLSRRKISLDGDEEQAGREVCLTAIHLLGDFARSQPLLQSLALDKESEVAAAALDSLTRIAKQAGELVPCLSQPLFPTHAKSEEAGEGGEETDPKTQIRDLLITTLSSAELTIKLQALRLAALTKTDSPAIRDLVATSLSDAEARVRIEAMAPHLAYGGKATDLLPLLDDPSSLVRQDSMRLLAHIAPDLAKEHLVAFLLANPEQTLQSVLKTNLNEKEQDALAATLFGQMQDQENKAQWAVILPAMAQIYSVGVA